MIRKFTLLRKVISAQPYRNLYSQSALGIDGYKITREKILEQFQGSNLDENKFREKMSQFSTDEAGNMIFTEDLKNMVHLAKSEDLDLIEKMLVKFQMQNKEMRFGLFVFGPVVMRCLYYLNSAETALKLFKDPNMAGFFDQLMSFQILMDLLYENQRYDDVLDVFDIVRAKQLKIGRYPKHSVVLAMGACYKLNTPKSLEYCIQLWKVLNEVGYYPMRKAATFAAGLALNQGSPQIALEILSTIKSQSYVSVRNLKLIAYAKLDRPSNAIPILRSSLNVDEPIYGKKTFIKTAIEELKKSIEKNPEKDLETDFAKIEKTLIANGQIVDETVEQMLCSEISATEFNGQPRNKTTMTAASFNEGSSNNNRADRRYYPNQRIQRVGLNDMY